MSESRPMSDDATTSGPTRRTLMRGAAWAAPVIAAAAVVPIAAASLPPCVGGVAGVAQNSWSVGARFAGCAQASHFDVSVVMTVVACQAERICIRLYDLGDESGSFGLRSRLWWADTDDQAPPYLFIEKCFDIPTQGSSPHLFAVQGDQVRSETSLLSPTSTLRGTMTACCSTENDGIHVNPCYFSGTGSSNRVAKFYYKLDDGPWTYGAYVNATQPQL